MVAHISDIAAYTCPDRAVEFQLKELNECTITYLVQFIAKL